MDTNHSPTGTFSRKSQEDEDLIIFNILDSLYDVKDLHMYCIPVHASHITVAYIDGANPLLLLLPICLLLI